MKLTEKMKKNLAILGGVLIGIGLIAAIGMQFGSKPSGKDVLPGTGETETELIVDPGDFEKKEEESKVVSREEESLVIHQGIGENQETDTQAVDSRAPQTDQTTQSIQPKPTKPEPPSKEILTDPTQKPDGTKQDTPPVPVDHEAVEKAHTALKTIMDILGILEEVWEKTDSPDDKSYNDLMDVILAVRQTARKEKMYKIADEIRDRLDAAGIVIEDTPTGARWKRRGV